MTHLKIISFCALCLLATISLFAALFPYSAMTREQVISAQQPLPMEDFAPVDLGEDYGQLSVFDLIGYYIDNPPKPETVDNEPGKKYFGGC